MAHPVSNDDREEAPLAVTCSIKETGPWQKSVTVTVSAEDVDSAFNSVTGEVAASVQLPGFRPGKTPRNIVEKRFAEEIRRQVTGKLIERAAQAAIEKEKLRPIGDPVLDVKELKPEKGQALSFELSIEVPPSFDLPNYKGLAVEQEEVEVLPEEMEQNLARFRARFGEEMEGGPEHAVADGDSISCVSRFLVDGNEVLREDDARLLVMEGHVLGAYAHLGSKFLLGAKIGEKRSVEETLSQDFPTAEQREKKALIEVEIKSVKTQKLPDMDDALAQKAGLKDLEDLKQKVRSTLLEKIGDEIHSGVRDKLLDLIAAGTSFELPQRLVEKAAERSVVHRLQYLERMGMPPEALAERREEFAGPARQDAIDEMRRYFILEAIAEKEGISVDDEEIDAEIVRQARSRKMRASEYYDKLEKEGLLAQLESNMKIKKVLDFLVDNAEIKVVPRKPQEQAHGHEHPEHAPHATGSDQAPAPPVAASAVAPENTGSNIAASGTP